MAPVSILNGQEYYTVRIPVGAFKEADGSVNDSLVFNFSTAKKLEPTSDMLNIPKDGFTDKSPNILQLDKNNRMPTLTYNIQLTNDGHFVSEENIKAELYKENVLQWDLGYITASGADSAYVLPFTPLPSFDGTYELVFTYGEQVCREPVTVHGIYVPGYIKFGLMYGRYYHEEATYLNVEINGEKLKAVKNGKYYEVQGVPYQVNQAYAIKITGWKLNTDKVYPSDDKPYPYPIMLSGQPLGGGGITIIDVTNTLEDKYGFMPGYFEGVDVGTVTYTVTGDWAAQDPGYFEVKTMVYVETDFRGGYSYGSYEENNRLNMTSVDGTFRMNPGIDFRIGEVLAFRMVANNGLDGGIPQFKGVLCDSWVHLDFNGSAGYSTVAKTSSPLRKANAEAKNKTAKLMKKVKKVKAVGYTFEFNATGDILLELQRNSNGNLEWKPWYVQMRTNGDLSRKVSTGYTLLGIIGVDGYVETRLIVGGTLRIKDPSGNGEYSGNIYVTPWVYAGVEGSYGIGYLYGYVSASIPIEVDYPTGYVGAGITVYAKIGIGNHIDYVIGSDNTTLYEATLANVHWDNGKDKVALGALRLAVPGGEITETENPEAAKIGLLLISVTGAYTAPAATA